MTEIEANGKTYTVKEIKYKDVARLSEVSKEIAAKQMIMLSTDMSEEEYENLSMKDGIKLQQEVNELNGLSDFQQPLTA